MLLPENARKFAIILSCIYMTGVALLFALIDAVFSLTYTWLYSGPVLLAGIIVGVATTVLYRSKRCAVCSIVFVSIVLSLHCVDLCPVKPYKRMFAAIRNGMSTAEVRQILKREFPENGRFKVPVVSQSSDMIQFILDPTDGSYNAEVIHIDLRNDRVVDKQYWPD